jgi:hypothetical protein
MPIELPVLDDKTYSELVQEARTAVPGHYPEWTDHNPSDPGIALVELMAWLSEMLIYRTGQIPERSVHTFLNILNGAPLPEAQLVDLAGATRTTLSFLRERWRAVTPEDYELLALSQWPDSEEAKDPALQSEDRDLARVRCLAERDLSSTAPTAVAPGHMSLLVLPSVPPAASAWDAPRTQLLSALMRFFRERRLVTTRLHVTGPTYVPVDLSATIYLRDDAIAQDVKQGVLDVLVRYFDPRSGGRDGKGWPFGREVPASEAYATLDATRGVEFVKDVTLTVAAALESRKVKVDGNVVAIRLEPHELPRVERSRLRVTLMERRGDKWEVVP